MKTIKQEGKILIGKHDNENIYLSVPTWECGWYWSFGYLVNENCHYHLNRIQQQEHPTGNINLFDAIKKHFGDTLCRPLQNEKNLWTFCDLVQTAYTLKETAEVLGRGGSHYTINPLKELIENQAEVKRINEIVLPEIFDAIYNIIKN